MRTCWMTASVIAALSLTACVSDVPERLGSGLSRSGSSGGGDAGTSDSSTTDSSSSDTAAVDTGVADSWPASWQQREADALAAVNAARARGADCGSEGSFGPTTALRVNATLVGTARAMSQDMGDRNFFDHVDPDGLDPFDRMQAAGYNGGAMGENIAAGYATGAEVVAGWLTSDGHCRNIMDPSFGVIGIGYANVPGSDYGDYWTQNFGDR